MAIITSSRRGAKVVMAIPEPLPEQEDMVIMTVSSPFWMAVMTIPSPIWKRDEMVAVVIPHPLLEQEGVGVIVLFIAL